MITQQLLDAAFQCVLAGLLVVPFMQPNAPRFFGAAIFGSLTISHSLLLSELDGLAYYGSAAIFDLLFMIITSSMSPVPDMIFSLYKVCLASMVVNAFGWVLWMTYQPHVLYNCAFLVIYGWAFVVLLRRGKVDVGDYTLDSWRTCFHFGYFAWRGYFSKKEDSA